jgi:hypothetical protein
MEGRIKLCVSSRNLRTIRKPLFANTKVVLMCLPGGMHNPRVGSSRGLELLIPFNSW